MVTVSITATVPIMAMGRSTLGVIEPHPRVWLDSCATYQSHSVMATPPQTAGVRLDFSEWLFLLSTHVACAYPPPPRPYPSLSAFTR
jgi:hypothetical protein